MRNVYQLTKHKEMEYSRQKEDSAKRECERVTSEWIYQANDAITDAEVLK